MRKPSTVMPARRTRARQQEETQNDTERRIAGLKLVHSVGDAVPGRQARERATGVAANSMTRSLKADGQDQGQMENIHEDDLCLVCRLLLFNPVITGCKHTLCKSCMATWAETTNVAVMTIVSVDDQPQDFDAATGLEAKCPMCRTKTSSSLDDDRSAGLRTKYPKMYAQREAEEAEDAEHKDSIQTITVYIGNRHQLISPPDVGRPRNMHEWSFFVRPSRTEIIEEVQIDLHPTFRPPRIIRQWPPYEIKRLGWGYFTIIASVILKPCYSWVSSDAEESPDGAPNGMLPLEWTLDFSSFGGTGAMGRCELKVKNDRQ